MKIILMMTLFISFACAKDIKPSSSPGPSVEEIGMLKKGMNQAEVTANIGDPTVMVTTIDGEAYIYSGPNFCKGDEEAVCKLFFHTNYGLFATDGNFKKEIVNID